MLCWITDGDGKDDEKEKPEGGQDEQEDLEGEGKFEYVTGDDKGSSQVCSSELELLLGLLIGFLLSYVNNDVKSRHLSTIIVDFSLQSG